MARISLPVVLIHGSMATLVAATLIGTYIDANYEKKNSVKNSIEDTEFENINFVVVKVNDKAYTMDAKTYEGLKLSPSTNVAFYEAKDDDAVLVPNSDIELIATFANVEDAKAYTNNINNRANNNTNIVSLNR